MDKDNITMFYTGQRVVAVDALPGSFFKNGTEYVVSAYEWKSSPNPIANGKYFWYIGIVGHANGSAYFRPGIFAPIIEAFQAITFEKVSEQEPVSIN